MKILRIILLTFISFFLIACGSGKTEQNEFALNMAILLEVARIDGEVNESEQSYMMNYLELHGLTEELEEFLDKTKKVQKNSEPASIYRIMRVFDEIVGVIKADGVVTDKERYMLAMIAADPNNLEKYKVLGIMKDIAADVEAELFTMESFVRLLSYTTENDRRQEIADSIVKYVKKWGRFNVGQVYVVCKDLSEITVPSDINRKWRVVESVVGFIKSDGEVTEKEKEFLIQLASDLNLDKENVLASL